MTVVGRNDYGELSADNWTDVIAVSIGDSHIVGLKSDGTVLAAGNSKSSRCSVLQWNQIVAVSAGNSHTVALTEDGRVLATGYDEYGQCQVVQLMSAAGSRKIVSIAAGSYHTAALLEDGTAVACGDTRFGACEVQNWTKLAAVYTGDMYTAGLRTDGTVVITGQNVEDWNTAEWKDIVNLAAGSSYLVGVKADGSVVASGFNSENLENMHYPMNAWEDIVYIGAGFDQTVAVNAAGEILCAGVNNYGQCDPQQVMAASESGNEEIDRTVASISIDKYVDYNDEYYNFVGMNASDEPVWIYMTAHFGTYGEGSRTNGTSCAEVIGLVGDMFFFREDHAVMALDVQTGSVVWKHREVEGESTGNRTESDGSTHIRGYSHDLYVTQEGVPSCAGTDGSGKCGLYETVKAKTAEKTASEVRFEYFYENGEVGNFVGLDRNGNPVWVYRTPVLENSQVQMVKGIGKYGNIYYLSEGGTVTALDIKNGKELWQNSDFLGAATGSWIDSNGTVFLTSYLGPDFFAVDAKGDTLCRVETFDEAYFWPSAIQKKSGKLHITFDMGPDYETYENFLITVNPRDFSYEIVGGINPY